MARLLDTFNVIGPNASTREGYYKFIVEVKCDPVDAIKVLRTLVDLIANYGIAKEAVARAKGERSDGNLRERPSD